MPIARDSAGRGVQALRPFQGASYKRTATAASQQIGPFVATGGAKALMVHVENGAIFLETGDSAVAVALPDGSGNGGGHRLSAAHGALVISLQNTSVLDTHMAYIAETGSPLVFVTELH